MLSQSQERTGCRIVIELEQVVGHFSEGKVLFGNLDLCQLDALIVKKVGANYGHTMLDRLNILRYVAGTGVPVFSRPETMLGLVNRIAGTVTLRNAGVPMPPTVVTENINHGVSVIRTFGQAILKPLFSTKARGMELVEWTNTEEVEAKLIVFHNDNPTMYIQQKIDHPGRDFAVVFLGDELVGSYARVAAPGVWNTTTRAGGHYEPHEPSTTALSVARQAREAFDLDFASVDMVEGEDGPLVFEVSAFGGFRGLRDALSINVAERYVDYVLRRLS